VDADNPQLNAKGAKSVKENASKGSGAVTQKSREALGNIGNRINKPTGLQGKPSGTGIMKPAVNALRSFVGGSKVTDTFAVPNARAPKAAVRSDLSKKPLGVGRSTSLLQPSSSTGSSTLNKNVTRPEVKSKVFTNLHRYLIRANHGKN
jgi:hypothetical protein